MLAIEVEYLMGRVFASDFRDRDTPEWPPHPDRLFSAMIAAHHDTFGTDSERAALQWFQRLAPPQVSAGSPGLGNRVVTFVPPNYAGKSGSTHPEQREKQPRTFPAQAPSSAVVHFVWPDAQPDESVRQALAAIVARVSSLGRACSLVRITLSDAPASLSHVPDRDGRHVLRVFGDRRMEELEALFASGLRPQPGPQARYKKLSGIEAPEPFPSCFGEMIVLKKRSGTGLPIESALTLTSATRSALIRIADENGLLCGLLSGHGAHPHCAVVPLPFAGYEHADGRLLGVAVLLPRNIDSADRHKIIQVCGLLHAINLIDERALWEVEFAGFDVAQTTLLPETWTRPSKVWSTVTPILLDRFPKKNLTVESILSHGCERVGLPAPAQIEHSPYSKLNGVAPVPQFRLLRTRQDPPRWGVHATLRFDVDIQGPLLLGAGRYFGLGLMKPKAEKLSAG